MAINSYNKFGWSVVFASALSACGGGDEPGGMLFAPNYGKSNDGAIDWVDLSATAPVTYAMNGADWSTYSKGTIGQADSGSVDNIYNVGLIAGKDISRTLAVNLDKSAYTFDAASQTFKATNASSSVVSNLPAMTLSGSAIDSTSHYALLMAGYSNDLVVAKIDNPAAPKSGTWTGIEDWRGYSMSCTDYTYARDPHAVGAFNIQGKSYGFLLNGISSFGVQKVLLVDMDAFLQSSRWEQQTADQQSCRNRCAQYCQTPDLDGPTLSRDKPGAVFARQQPSVPLGQLASSGHAPNKKANPASTSAVFPQSTSDFQR